MIDKKEKITKQFLLSFKKSHGDLYEKFIDILKGKVHFGRQVKQNNLSCPQHMVAQKCIFFSIMQKKHLKFKLGQFDMTLFAKVLSSYRDKILKSIKEQKKSILNQKKQLNLEDIQNSIIEIITRQNFAFNPFDIVEYTYIYQLIKGITCKSQQVSFLGSQKYQPFTYTQNQIKQICKQFDQNIVFIDYNASKNPTLPQQFKSDTTYILRIKDKYLIMYVQQPKQISIIQQSIISIDQLQSFFNNNKKQPQQQGFFDRLIGSDIKQKKSTIKLFPDQIQCSKCRLKFTQFDSLKWGYQYFCRSCLQNPFLDTSTIPSTLIQKYFLQRGIVFGDYEINCAQCTGITTLRKYHPAQKPKKYLCEICQHKICIQHNQNIYKCFCECSNCNQTTINIVNLQLSVCQRCKKKMCRKCQKYTDNFCACVCKVCYQLKQDGHNCRQRCHFCYNHINKMKICACGSKVCYGCYYYQLKKNPKLDAIKCSGPVQYN